MRALQLIKFGASGNYQFGVVPDPIAGAEEILVKVKACGINHLDLWLEAGELPINIGLPRIPGGEISGEIVQAATSGSDWKVGDRVAVQSNLFCGKCEFCLRGDESLCLNGLLLGVQRDGGLAELVSIPVSALVRLPDNVSFEASAAMTLAGSTAMHMLTNRARIRSADWVLVIGGASGVGAYAVQIAKQLGASVIATASSEEKSRLARELGADHVVDSRVESWPGEVRKITQKRGVDFVVEHVGGKVFEQAIHCLARGGTVVTCGATAGKKVNLDLWPFFVKQQRIIGSYGRNRSDMELILAWASAGKVKPVIDSVFSLSEAEKGLEKLRERKVLGKVIVTV
ncbi:MAG: zinc-binding dehydrogenase [Verrucomicrobiota bacterium]|nr:zinc-binding dehydrogenase [Verrucomicrobiota bacterium]